MATDHDLRRTIRAHLALGLTSWTGLIVLAAGFFYLTITLTPPRFLSASSDHGWWYSPVLIWPMIAQGAAALIGVSLLVRAGPLVARVVGGLLLAGQIAVLASLVLGMGVRSIAIVGMIGLALCSAWAYVTLTLSREEQRRSLSGGALRALGPHIYWRDPLSVLGNLAFLVGQLLRLIGILVVIHIVGAIVALTVGVLFEGGDLEDAGLMLTIIGVSFVAAFVLAVTVFVMGIALRMIGRWIIRASLARSLTHDARAPTLFLRAFDEDQVAFDKGSGLLSRMLYGASRLDHILVEQFSRLGPVVAIGRPGSSPPFGAARIFVDDDHWKERVLELSEKARAIVVVVNNTEGLRWEIDTMLSGPFRDRALFLRSPSTSIAPVGSKLADLISPSGAPATMPFALYQSASGEEVRLEGPPCTAHAYQVALEVFFADRMETVTKKRASFTSAFSYTALAALLIGFAGVFLEEWRWRRELADAAQSRPGATIFQRLPPLTGQPLPVMLAAAAGRETLFPSVGGGGDGAAYFGPLERYQTSHRVTVGESPLTAHFSPGGNLLLRYNRAGAELIRFDTNERFDLGVLPRLRPRGCVGFCMSERFAFSPDGQSVALRYEDRFVIYAPRGSTSLPHNLTTFPRSVRPVALASDGVTLVIEGAHPPQNRWSLWNVPSLDVINVATGVQRNVFEVREPVFRSGEGMLALSRANSRWYHIDLRNGVMSELSIPPTHRPRLARNGRAVLSEGGGALTRHDPSGASVTIPFEGEVRAVSDDAMRVLARVGDSYAIIPIETGVATIPVQAEFDAATVSGDRAFLSTAENTVVLDLLTGALSQPIPSSSAGWLAGGIETPTRSHERVFGNSFVVEHERPAPTRGDVTSTVCAGSEIPVFATADRAAFAPLRGRPWNVCDWRGLASAEGRAQFVRMVRIRYFGAPDYRCGEVDAAGSTTSDSLARCEG